ncbi:hypothetical protein [Halobacterium zhouii]|uniref:hypothetical protein n=1 Tax=Halobacterium zhouii TaxID=2902624 RepID=UPI001E34A4CF|nr:hypothetical protein [Halobacterium zhouii]
MLRDVLRRLAARIPGREAGERGVSGTDANDGTDTGYGADGNDGAKTDDEGDESRFRPSVLDASVRYAHGMDDGALERELADIQEQAQERRDRRRGR